LRDLKLFLLFFHYDYVRNIFAFDLSQWNYNCYDLSVESLSIVNFYIDELLRSDRSAFFT